VCSPAPKSNPDTVTEYPPDIAKFGCRVNDTAGASKLKTARPVPDTVATVTVVVPKMSPNGFERHASVVADVHDDVKHTPRSPPPPRSSPAVAVCSPTPKSSPDTVKDAYPVSGAFRRTFEATAASKLKIGCPVPDTEATVTVEDWKMSPNGFDRHRRVVADIHDDVKHTPRSPPPPRSSPIVAV
jgi:hypothetical protein